MEAMEINQRREPDMEDVSESENVISKEGEKGTPGGKETEEQLIILVTKVISRPKM
jgi:hypothetical protein